MTEAPSRRAVVAGLAAAGTDCAAFLRPAKAAPVVVEPGPIELACIEYARLSQLADAAAEVKWEREDRFEEPERPAFHWRLSEGSYDLVRVGDGTKGRCYIDTGTKNEAGLKEIIAWTPPEDEDERHWHNVRVRRAKATLAKIEAWRVEYRRRSDAVGLPAALEASNRADAAEKAQALLIFEMVPTTLREVGFQAALLRNEWSEEKVEAVLAHLVRLANINPDWPYET